MFFFILFLEIIGREILNLFIIYEDGLLSGFIDGFYFGLYFNFFGSFDKNINVGVLLFRGFELIV